MTMKRTLIIATLAIMSLFGTTACAQKKGENMNSLNNKKVLVAYFSWSGNTKAAADYITQKLNADQFEIVAEKNYDMPYMDLIKVAQTEHIDCININELAQGLRTEYLPGDKLRVKIVSEGSNPKQGVAYLPDGTMVVVDNAESYAGKKEYVEIEFVRYLQTNAGKMMFAKLAEKPKKQGKANGRKANNKPRQKQKNKKQ